MPDMLKKYSTIFRFMTMRALYYRTELFVWSLIETLPFAILILFLVSVFAQKPEINGYDLPKLIQYYLLALIITSLTDFHFEDVRAREIREGKIDFYLARPFSYIEEILLRTFNSKIIFLVFLLPVVSIIYFLSSLHYGVAPIHFFSLNFLIFCGLILAAATISIFLSLWIVMATFWLEGSNGLTHFRMIGITLFSGAMIPIKLMPNWLQQIVNWLPLKYLYAIPIEVIQGTYQISPHDMLILAGTITAMLFITKIFWKNALIQYCSVN